MPARTSRGLILPEGHTGSSLFHSVLSAARDRFARVFESAAFPRDARVFKGDYGTFLARFEAARASSPERVAIAREIVRGAQSALQFAGEGAMVPLAEYLSREPPEVKLGERTLGTEPRFVLEVPFEGKTYSGRDVHQVVDRLAEEHSITAAAHEALASMIDRITQGGGLDLRGQRFALLGAGAELAPARLLLAAGARVLWIDVADPDRWLASAGSVSGTLVTSSGAGNLLEAPLGVVAALRRFAAEGPMHVGMFAYASGASQEWRLSAAMHAIVARLDPDTVRSVSMLVSPTSPVTVRPESLAAARRALAAAPRWKTALSRTGLLASPGHHSSGGVDVARATVSIQGMSYQAAQYIAKLMAAEIYAVHGIDADASVPRPVTVSANVAGITRTRSLQHPLFQAAFIGAKHFGVRIFDPATTRALSGLLLLHDVLREAAPAGQTQSAVLDDVFSRQVHGGIYSMPYVLEPAIRIAALIGMGRRPGLLLGRRSSAGHEPALTGAP